MKKTAALAALMIMSLFALSAPPALAGEREGSPISLWCALLNDLGLTHGACVAFFETGNIVPHDASICRDPAIQDHLGVSNEGQCIKKLREMRR